MRFCIIFSIIHLFIHLFCDLSVYSFTHAFIHFFCELSVYSFTHPFICSKVLFVLSYNDPDQIDRILLDRIHRVKFSHLSMADKLHIARNYTLPDIYSEVGLSGSVSISEEVVRFIIDNYTCEAGIRKLKEKLFEIVTDVNLELLSGNIPKNCPVIVTVDDVKNKYFKEYNPVIVTQVPSEPRVGYAIGLWAN